MPHSPPDLSRILLVDDSEADNVFHELVLRRAGFQGELKVFDDPRLALAHLQCTSHGAACLVLLDINMPLMNGWEFAEAAAPLRGDGPTVLVVMLTSSAADEDRRRAASMPTVDGYVTKPLTLALARELLAGAWPRPA